MKSVLSKFRQLRSHLVSGYWFIPGVTVLSAGLLALVLLRIDAYLQRADNHVGFTGGPDSARSLLAAVASSTLTIAALVFSVTVLVLQLASGQFSPRVLRTFLRDKRSQLTLGVFLATFVYSLTVLRDVRGEDGTADRFVPGVSIAVAFVLVLVSVGFFVQYIHNIANSIRVIEIIDRISRETIHVIERLHPAETGVAAVGPPLAPVSGTVAAESRGVVTSIDLDRLRRAAGTADVVLAVVPRVGDFVAQGMPLVAVHGKGEIKEGPVRSAFSFGKEREIEEDPAFGFRQLVDIAERALSPGVNDPTTATQCLDHIHDLLRRLADRPLAARMAHDDDGRLRVVAAQPSWEDYVCLALEEIRRWGSESLQINQRIAALLDDLETVVSPERAVILREQRRHLRTELAA